MKTCDVGFGNGVEFVRCPACGQPHLVPDDQLFQKGQPVIATLVCVCGEGFRVRPQIGGFHDSHRPEEERKTA